MADKGRAQDDKEEEEGKCEANNSGGKYLVMILSPPRRNFIRS